MRGGGALGSGGAEWQRRLHALACNFARCMSVCVSRVVHQRSLSSRSSSSSDTAHDSTFSGGCGSAGLLWLDEAEAETTVPLQPADDAETLTTVATAAGASGSGANCSPSSSPESESDMAPPGGNKIKNFITLPRHWAKKRLERPRSGRATAAAGLIEQAGCGS